MKKILVFLSGIVFLSFQVDTFTKGEQLFTNNCEGCHALDEVRLGPALACVGDHLENEWVYQWLRDADGLIQSGNPYAKEIFAAYQIPHPVFDFSEDQIDEILVYLKIQCDNSSARRIEE